MSDLAIGSGMQSFSMTDMVRQSSSANKLERTLEKGELEKADDAELMEACKSFEAYFVEQAFKEMQNSIHKEEDSNDYMKYFGDTLVQEYAKSATEGQGLGIAQTLYESMKRQ